jgi:simple sugar transport system permease protein
VRALPPRSDLVLLPLLNLAAALAISGLVVAACGEDPVRALRLLVGGALGDRLSIAFTLHYATTFLFAGLAVALPFHAGQFNIGGEGQAYVAGLGVAGVCFALPGAPWWAVFAAAILAAALCGAGWALVPAVLQAWRGSHLVITTVMFNFIASAAMAWLLVGPLRDPAGAAPESRGFAPELWPPSLGGWVAGAEGAPLNLAFLVALVAIALVAAALRRTVWGLEVRATGFNPLAARFAGVPVGRRTVAAVTLGGALAGLAAVNEVLGAQHRLILDFPAGAGFVGIAVAMLGRNHPVGVGLAALLFGALAQGGAELSFDMPTIRRETLLVIEGVVVLFCGGFENLFRAPVVRGLLRRATPG